MAWREVQLGMADLCGWMIRNAVGVWHARLVLMPVLRGREACDMNIAVCRLGTCTRMC